MLGVVFRATAVAPPRYLLCLEDGTNRLGPSAETPYSLSKQALNNVLPSNKHHVWTANNVTPQM